MQDNWRSRRAIKATAGSTSLLGLGIWLLVLSGCYDSTDNESGNAVDGSIDDAGSLDGFVDGAESRDSEVETQDSEQDAEAFVDVCTDEMLDCICEWSPALRIGSIDYESVYLLSDLVHDASGAVVVGWGGRHNLDEDEPQPFRMHLLNPSTEQWIEQSPEFPNRVNSVLLARDDQDSLLVFTYSIEEEDWTWSRLNATTRRWSESLLLGLPKSTGRVIKAPGYTYWVDYPIVSRFVEGRFQPSSETEPESHLKVTLSGVEVGVTSIDIDGDGNLVAAWDDIEIEVVPSPLMTAHIPVYNGLYVSIFDGASGQWSTPTMLTSEGRIPDVAFASDGDAYILYEVGEEQHMQRRDANSGQWSEAEVMPENYSFYRNGDGPLFRVHSCPYECVFSAAMLDPDSETWSETSVSADGFMIQGSLLFAFVGEYGVAQWLKDCDDDGVCAAQASIMANANDWSSPTTIAPSFRLDTDLPPPLAIGEDGTVVMAWVQKASSPYDEPDELYTVRYDPGSTSWSDPVQLDAISGMDDLAVTVDSQGAATVLWTVQNNPAMAGQSGFQKEVWTSRYACRLRTPEGTQREAEQ